jgi:NAD(P)-dependent dehydrogenase (short-subunit alcohol dehydrogenase family)
MAEELVVVTGANRGIGRSIAAGLAGHGRKVILACRDLAGAKAAEAEINRDLNENAAEALHLDLASLESVRSFADLLRRRGDRIGTLINNAGVLPDRYVKTIDGFELALQVNYLGTFLLTSLLVPLFGVEGGQVINASSVCYRIGSIGSGFFEAPRGRYRRFKAYADSKLAMLMFTNEIAGRLADRKILANSVDPGIVDTNIISQHNAIIDGLADALFRPFIRSPDEGAEASILLAIGNREKTGAYFVRNEERRIHPRYDDVEARKALYERTNALLGI